MDPVTAYSKPGANFNRYWYANNNPYRFTDPDGRLDRELAEWRKEQAAAARQSSEPKTLDTVTVSASRQSGTSSGQQTGDSGFSAKGLLAGKPSVEASGMAAAGGGIQATKGLYNADSSVGVVTPALGLTASVDVNLIALSYKGDSAQQAPVEVKMGFDVDAHAILGGSISLGYTPPSTFEFSVDAGAGAGAGFKVFEVNAVIDED